MVKEIYATSGEIAIVDDDVFEELAKFSWRFEPNQGFHSVKSVNGKRIKSFLSKTVYELKRLPPSVRIYQKVKGKDYTLNNLSNKRSSGDYNTRKDSIAKSGPKSGKYKGVSFDECSKKWRASHQFCFKNKSSRHKTEIEAAKAFDAMAFAVYGTECYLNFPEDFGLPARERDDNG